MSKRLLLFSGNFYPEPTGIGKYTGEMIDWLSKNGFECTVVTTYPYYPMWKIEKQYKKNQYWFKKEVIRTADNGFNPVTIIRCPHYVPTIPTGIKRLISELSISFSFYLVLLTLLFTRKFNYVLTIAPPFELGLLGVIYKRIRGAKFLYHIQDLQIDAARDLQMIKSSFVLKTLFAFETYIIKNADFVSTISQGMINKVKAKHDTNIVYFPNWVDTSIFYPIMDKGKLKEHYGFSANDKIILYSGAIGEKQGLQSIIHAAKFFQINHQVKFVICGSGPYKQHLINLKESLHLHNVIFLPLQLKSDFNYFLNMADVHLILQKAKASDLVMPSKLSTIFSVGGVSIVTANTGSSLHDIMNSSEMGFLIAPDNQEILNNAIQHALQTDLTKKSINARKYATNNLSIDEILTRYINNVIQSVSSGLEPSSLHGVEKSVISLQIELKKEVC